VRVEDDGVGFDPAAASRNGHFGLAGMRERASAIGARLTVDSLPGRGTIVDVAARGLAKR
jgi:signal transduction histidine kinase